MTAQLIETGSEAEWLAARRQGVTASEIAVVMGLSPYDSPFALYHRKRGDLPGIEEDDAMALGRHMESYVADQFAKRHPEFTVIGDGRTLFAHPGRQWQMATPDRQVYEVSGMADRLRRNEPLALLECKIDAGGDGWGEDGSDQIPVHYRCQILWQCDVMAARNWYLACLDWRSRKIRVYEGKLDDQAEADLQLMRDEAALFLKSIDYGKPPDVDWRPQTTAALKHLHPSLEDRDAIIPRALARQYKAACRAYKAAEQRKKTAENRIRERIGNATRARTDDKRGPGQPIVTRQVYEVKEHTRKASTVDKLVPAKPPKDAAS